MEHGVPSKVQVFSPQLSIETEVEHGKIVVKIKSDVPKGQTFVINIGNATLTISDSSQVLVLYDGKEISLASNYTDVLNPNDEDAPEYLVLMLRGEIQFLVSISRFSTHIITITQVIPPQPFPRELVIMMFVFSLVFVTIAGIAIFVRRRRRSFNS